MHLFCVLCVHVPQDAEEVRRQSWGAGSLFPSPRFWDQALITKLGKWGTISRELAHQPKAQFINLLPGATQIGAFHKFMAYNQC